MRVDPTTHAAQQASTGVRAAASRANGGATFASALARASSTEAAGTDSELKSKRGESLKAITGHKYARILEGERKGQFVNMSGNERDGKAFERVRRDGREWHVYGTGAHRVCVEVKHKDDAASNDTTPSSTTDSTSGTNAASS